MCGIFTIINNNEDNNINYNNIRQEFNKGKHRGPEFSTLNKYNNVFMGFHRLAINGLNVESNQPFVIDNIILICNGEIYNYKTLALFNFITLTTQSDCEIIIHLYKKYGIEYTLSILDGVFAFVLYDQNINKLIVARDPYGVRPLYYYHDYNSFIFASELKVLYNLSMNKKKIHHFLPANYMIIHNN